ncbi:anti-sigma factor [Micromonospora echinofusca]|uniref:Anti-sigma factor n=1 Tax=Micromonospora echinofusca TaxID=47858 RepID=A0ABS3VK81_MICEH|nr:anti-sigma factor [Micromonospora echinofusca]MBO4204925.1 anti-sigma factor [Micromonospora echinofusca]
MSHLDHDRLVFLALGELTAAADDTRHLDSCVACRDEFESLRHVAGLGADTQGLTDLPAPPEHVWQNITAEIAAAQALPSLGEVRRQRTGEEPVGAAAHGPGSTGPATVADPPVVPTPVGDRPAGPLRDGAVPTGPGDADRPPRRRDTSAPGRRSGRGRLGRWVVTAATAVAAAAIGVVGTVVALRPYAPEPPAPTPAVVAQAPLSAYGSTPASASGSARVFKDGRLHLHVSNLPQVPGYYEVWLINPSTMKMFSVGVLGDGSDVLLPLPPNVDLDSFRVVDVSAEGYDNNQAHSGDSLLRGTLTS